MSSKKRLSDFKAFTDDQSAEYYARHLPKGRLWAKKFDPDSVIYKLCKCLGTVNRLVTGQMETIAKNFDMSQADELLENYETDYGIPDIYPRRTTTAGRREAIQRKRSKVPVFEVQSSDYIDIDMTFEEYVRKMTGITIVISTTGTTSYGFAYSFPIHFLYNTPAGYFHFIVTVYDQGTSLSDTVISQLDTVLDSIIPKFCDWEYEVGED